MAISVQFYINEVATGDPLSDAPIPEMGSEVELDGTPYYVRIVSLAYRLDGDGATLAKVYLLPAEYHGLDVTQ